MGDVYMKVPEAQENKSKCECVKGCSTYDKSRLTGVLYCSVGKSAETVQRSGCYCPRCGYGLLIVSIGHITATLKRLSNVAWKESTAIGLISVILADL